VLVSISAANMMTMSRMLVVFFAFDGKHSGLEPEILERSNVQWLCCKCESINVSTFTFRSYMHELETSNIYEHLSNLNESLDSD
jgi:hypothetical protein